MTTLGNHQHRHADWTVTAVFDPDGEGHDLAYTVGLFERSLPELHIWGRPSLGEDPGADWKFSPRDCCEILNDLAWRLIDGDVQVGHRWEQAFDGAMVTARFQLDPPGDRDELEAFGIHPAALVLPVRWSLHRRPIGRPRPLTKRALLRATSEYADLLAELDDTVRLPDGWALPAEFVPGGGLGPLTPMVAGRVAEFWTADATTLANLACAAVTMRQGGGVTWPVGVTNAVGRGVGRVAAMVSAQEAARDVVESRMSRPDWPQVQREVAAVIGFGPDEISSEQLHRSLREDFTELLWTVLSTEVVADRLTKEQRLHGRGAWQTGLGVVGDLPGPDWRAPRVVLDRLFTALRPLSTTTLTELMTRHLDAERSDYQRLGGCVQGWAITAAAGCPFVGGLDRLPGVTWPQDLDELQEWATVMTSAACHRDRLSATDVATLTAPYLDLVPELPAFISAGGR